MTKKTIHVCRKGGSIRSNTVETDSAKALEGIVANVVRSIDENKATITFTSTGDDVDQTVWERLHDVDVIKDVTY